MVVLDEFRGDAKPGELARIPGFHEEAARVTEPVQLHDPDVGDRRALDLHGSGCSESRRSRYSPYPLLAKGLASRRSCAPLM